MAQVINIRCVYPSASAFRSEPGLREQLTCAGFYLGVIAFDVLAFWGLWRVAAWAVHSIARLV